MKLKFLFILLLLLFLYLLKIKENFEQKNIFVVDFIGGLGNQLFFLATAFEYATKNNKKIIKFGL